MTEPEEILVSGEFAAFRAAYAPAVRPAGTNAVRLTVRRRRQRAAVATAAAVVLAVVVPMGAHAALNRSRPVAGAGTDRRTDARRRRPTPTPAPATPTTTPSTASPTSAGPDGRISRAQLLAARVDLPGWPSYTPATCTTDNVRLREPQPDQRPELGGELRYGDVNGDGAHRHRRPGRLPARGGPGQAGGRVLAGRHRADRHPGPGGRHPRRAGRHHGGRGGLRRARSG